VTFPVSGAHPTDASWSGGPVTVTCVPGQYRPGVGRPPRREGRRPLLPQQARLCGPLEAGSALGFLVYPALADHEAFQLRRTGPGELELAFFGGDEPRPAHLFTLHFAMPGSGTGVWSVDVTFLSPACTLSEPEIMALREALVRSGSIWTPQGAVAVRGATDFRTPPGWDTVFTGVLNQVQAPVLSVLTARVETDWYAFDTEFRYVLQVGEVLSGSGRIPVGQAFVVPRAGVDLRRAEGNEVEDFRSSQVRFVEEKRRHRSDNALGLEYDTVYREASRGTRRAPGPSPGPEGDPGRHPC